jgi:signal transduction histidine kinase/ligand-binding sensor domain-containing protein
MIRRAAPNPHTQKEVAPDAVEAVDLASMPGHPCRMTPLTLIAVTLAVASVSAQEPAQTLSQLYHTAWTQRDGAPANIETLAQTADGFLWLGSGTGLFRFDGVRFELFEPPARQSLPSANVSALLATRDSGLWVGYRFGGISLIERGTIRSYDESDGLPRGSVISIIEDSAGTTWVGTTDGLARFDGGRWRRVGPAEGFAEGAVSAILADRSRRLWVSAEAGVFMRVPGAPRFERVAPPLTSSGGSRIYSYLQEGPDGAIWGSSQDRGLRVLSPSSQGGEAGVRPLPRESMAILIDRTGALWLAHPRNGGIERFWLHPSRGAAQRPEPQRLAVGLSSNAVLRWLEDREGNVWVGTTGGLDRFRRAKLNRVDLPGLQEDIALAPADSGAVWVGSAGRHLLRLGDDVREFPEVSRPVELAYRDRTGVAWVGSPFGLWRFSRGRFVRVGLPVEHYVGLQALTHDSAGNLWLSIPRSGVYQRTGDCWVPFGGRSGLPREPAIVLTTDDSGRTWFGYTANRVAVLQGDTVHLYTDKDGLSVGNVLAIHVRGPTVLVGGEFGLAMLAEGRFRPVTGRNGTAFRGTSGIVETPDGEVWLHGAIGITRIPAVELRRQMRDSTYQVENERLDFRDGLDGSAPQIRPQPTVIAGTDGRLWFATSVNVAWLDPRAVPRNPVPPPVVIRRLTAGSRSYPIGPALDLPVHTTALRIDYTALSLSVPERVRFRYQLVGSDTAWQDAGGRREAFYTNLAPGSYRFRVIAANDDGVWNQAGAAFDFTIPPSFVQSRWFLGVWVAALAALAWLAYLARMREVAGGLRLRYQAALAERTRIAQELHDTLLQGFTGITLQLRAIERLLVQRPQESAEALKNVLASADTALRDARHMIWDMRAVELEGRDLAEALEAAAHHAMAGSSAELVLAVQGERRRLPLDVETTALRVGREAVINAVKHATPRTLQVSLEFGARFLTLRVADDGAGISPGAMETAVEGEHLGIAGMRQRAQRAGGTLDITSEPGRGTTVSVSLPIRETPGDFTV